MVNINEVFYLKYDENWKGHKPYSDKKHHILLFVEEGQCIFNVNNKQYKLNKGDTFFIASHAVHEAIESGVAHSRHSVHWIDDELLEYFPYFDNQAFLFKTGPLYNYLKKSFLKIRHLWIEKDLFFKALCATSLLEISVRIHQEHNSLTMGTQVQMVQQVKDYILEYFNEPISISELAYHVKRNPAYVITSFKNYYGVPPIEFMHRTRIDKAEELLLTSNASIQSIAEQLGYCDSSYFSRMFKRFNGVTVSEYRKRYWR